MRAASGLVGTPAGCDHGAMSEQNAPIQDGSLDASAEAKKQGILVQVAADLPGRPAEEIEQMLSQRLSDAGLVADPDEVRALAASLPSVSSQSVAENEGPRAADS